MISAQKSFDTHHVTLTGVYFPLAGIIFFPFQVS